MILFFFFFLFFFYFFNNKTVITSYNCLFYVLLLVSRVLWRLYNYSVPKISFCLKLKGSFKYSNNISDAISSRFIKPRRISSSNCTIFQYLSTFYVQSIWKFVNFFSLHQNWQKRAERRVCWCLDMQINIRVSVIECSTRSIFSLINISILK